MDILKSEPIKGKLYAVLSRDSRGAREGITIGRFINREYHGCQLHGDRLGFFYVFARNDVKSCTNPKWISTMSVYVIFDENEKDGSKIMSQLRERVMPLPDDFDPFTLFEEIL